MPGKKSISSSIPRSYRTAIPSLLRLADLLAEHKDYKVKVTGNTDIIGSAAYNEKLAMARAETVKAFLVKYGASAAQITTAGDGKRDPEVDNKTKEGRFMNRRVVIAVTDGQWQDHRRGPHQRGASADAGHPGHGQEAARLLRPDPETAGQLDDILAAVKALQGDNDRLKSELADLRNQQNALKDQVNGMPKAVTEPQAQSIVAKAEPEIAKQVEDQGKANNHSISNVGLNIGPAFGMGRANNTHVTASAHGMFFTPFGADRTTRCRPRANTTTSRASRKASSISALWTASGPFQAGAFSSFKYINFGQYQQGSVVGQASFLADYLFPAARSACSAPRASRTMAC